MYKYIHTETPGIVPKEGHHHLNDPQQKAKPQPRICQEIELYLSALLKEFSELAPVHHHLVYDAVLYIENLVSILLELHRELF